VDYRPYIALRFLLKRKGTFIASVAALVIGVMVILFNSLIFNGVAQGILRDITNYRFGDVVVTKNDGNFGSDGIQLMDYVNRAFSYVKGSAPRLSSIAWMNSTEGGAINQVDKIIVIGIDPNRDAQASTLSDTVKEGSFLVSRGEIILGGNVASDLRADIGTSIDVRMISLQGKDVIKKFTIVGISRSAGLAFDDSAIMNIEDVRTITGRPNETDQIIIKLTDSAYQSDLKAHLLRAYAQHNIKVQTIEEAGRDILAGIRSGIGFINLVGYFGLLSASFAIVTIMMLIVSSKTRDIGIMQSLGANRRDILAIFVLQGLIIGCIAAICSFFVGTAAALYLQSSNFSFGSNGLVLDIRYDPIFTLFSSLFSILLGTAASIYPALRASRLQPVEAMQLI
jgi:lipoprotein-releasing system permease protein